MRLRSTSVAARAPDWCIIPAIAADGSLFPVEKMQAHRAGTLHLAVSVFVFAGEEMLIQRRAAAKYHCGGQWANTCCTHPYWGESLKDAAQRRLFEELGFRSRLAPAGVLTYATPVTQGLFEHERVQVFAGSADRTRLRLAPNPEEVWQTRWASRAALQAEVDDQPLNFAPWFRIYLKRWDELGLDKRVAPVL